MTELDFSSSKFNGINVAADWIKDLESSDSRLHKEQVISKALMAAQLGSSSAQCFLFNCYAAYNPFWVYHVRQIPETHGIQNRSNPWPRFWALCEALRTRSVTGHAARDQIQALSQEFDSVQWNQMCRRVLIKDLRCGITEKTLNRVLGNTSWAIPVFACQLAHDSTEQTHKMQGIKRLEVKLDGVRVLAVVTRNSCVLYSRNGRVMENFPQVAEAIMANCDLFAPVNSGTFVLDGEIVGENFQQLMRQAHRKTHAQTSDMVYHVFDIVPGTEFFAGLCTVAQHHRLAWLESAGTALADHPCLRVMPGMTVDLDLAEGHDVMRRFADAAVAQGYEGLMIKDPAAPYKCKRTTAWLKWKPHLTVDLEVVSVEEGTGRNQGRLGALVCEGLDNGKKICVNVGTGFSDHDRVQNWQSRARLPGLMVEVAADAVTQNQDGTYSLRFPRFVRFRGFEPGEKL